MKDTFQYSDTVRLFIVDNFLFGDASKLSSDTLLIEKGIIDSTGVLELVAFLEDNFNFTIKDEELVQDNFASLNAIEKFLNYKLTQAS
jgi:acyl carrier protein